VAARGATCHNRGVSDFTPTPDLAFAPPEPELQPSAGAEPGGHSAEPAQPARPGPLAWTFWVLFFVGTFVLDSLPYLTSKEPIQPGMLDDPKMVLYSIVGVWMSLAVVLLLAWRTRLTRQDMGLVGMRLKPLLTWSLGVFACLAITGVVPSLIWGEKLQVVEPLTRAPQGIAHWMLWIGLAASAGLVEEIVMRGYGIGFLLRAGAKPWWAAIAMSLYFGSLHVYEGPAAVPVIALWGFFFAYSYLKTGSILPGVIAHSMIDGIAPLFVNS